MFKQVLLAVDLNHDSSWRRALPAALAQCTVSGGSLTVAMVMPDFHMPLVADFFPENFERNTRAAIEKRLAQFVADEVPDSVTVEHRALSGGRVYERILELADAIDTDLIVMAASNPDVKTYLLGPNAARVMRHARQSVLVVRD